MSTMHARAATLTPTPLASSRPIWLCPRPKRRCRRCRKGAAPSMGRAILPVSPMPSGDETACKLWFIGKRAIRRPTRDVDGDMPLGRLTQRSAARRRRGLSLRRPSGATGGDLSSTATDSSERCFPARRLGANSSPEPHDVHTRAASASRFASSFFAFDGSDGRPLIEVGFLDYRVVPVRCGKSDFRVHERIDQDREDSAATGCFGR
jgi:hypothetical protein